MGSDRCWISLHVFLEHRPYHQLLGFCDGVPFPGYFNFRQLFPRFVVGRCYFFNGSVLNHFQSLLNHHLVVEIVLAEDLNPLQARLGISYGGIVVVAIFFNDSVLNHFQRLLNHHFIVVIVLAWDLNPPQARLGISYGIVLSVFKDLYLSRSSRYSVVYFYQFFSLSFF